MTSPISSAMKWFDLIFYRSECLLMDDLEDLDIPNCPKCRVRMEPVQKGRAVMWECSECGTVRIT